MPAISITETHIAHTAHPLDWHLLWILVIVAGILVFQCALALAWIRFHNLNSKARWRRLRERGVVVVHGPALVWAADLPPRRDVSYINLGQAMQHASRVRVMTSLDREPYYTPGENAEP
jgi:hypothetical protein